MRDSHDNLIELLEASKAKGIYSALIQHRIGGELLKLRFGVEPGDFSRLKRMLEFRPFEDTGVGAYRYFFAHSYREDPQDDHLSFIGLRVEQNRNHKQFEFPLGKNCIANLLWFGSLEDRDTVKDFIEK